MQNLPQTTQPSHKGGFFVVGNQYRQWGASVKSLFFFYMKRE